jgi:hypothetical protein
MFKKVRDRVVRLPAAMRKVPATVRGWRLPSPPPFVGNLLRKSLVPLSLLLMSGVAFFLGRSIGVNGAGAQQPQPPQSFQAKTGDGYTEDEKARVVAYIYDREPIYRVELAEHLIARFGAERLEFLVNRIIVERACKARNIFVTDAEVEAQFRADMMAIGPHMTAATFQKEILSRYNKSLIEWKEDVLRPKLMLSKLCRPMVTVTEEDLRHGFEGRYGPKVQCRMISCKDMNTALKIWNKISHASNVEQAFLEEAKQQYINELAATAGHIPPIHKHFGDARVEKEAFNLKPGQLSQLMELTEGQTIMLFCERHIPAESLRRFEDERFALEKEILEMKLSQTMADVVKKLRQEARPRLLLARPGPDQIRMDAGDMLKATEPQFRSQHN